MQYIILASIYLVINLATFFVYWLDKRKAVKQKQRISEKALLIFAACFGGIGALIAMYKCHHKTKKWKFKICVPLFSVINLTLLYFIVKLLIDNT